MFLRFLLANTEKNFGSRITSRIPPSAQIFRDSLKAASILHGTHPKKSSGNQLGWGKNRPTFSIFPEFSWRSVRLFSKMSDDFFLIQVCSRMTFLGGTPAEFHDLSESARIRNRRAVWSKLFAIQVSKSVPVYVLYCVCLLLLKIMKLRFCTGFAY